jgi:hypothetical protein
LGEGRLAPKFKKNSKNLTQGDTKNSLNAAKIIIKKAYLEPKLLNFERCNFVPSKLSLIFPIEEKICL